MKLLKALANTLTYGFNPMFFSLYTFSLLVYATGTPNPFTVFLISAIFSMLVPLAFLLLHTNFYSIKDLNLPNKSQRNDVFILSTLGYITGIYFLFYFQASPIITSLMITYLINTALLYVINLKWKISVHMMGFMGPWVALAYVFDYYSLLLLPVMLLVGWSRHHLKAHTWDQIVYGAVSGFVLTWIEFYILMNFVF